MTTGFTVAQVALLACVYLPGVSEPARGAFLLMSLWCFGASLGARFARMGVSK